MAQATAAMAGFNAAPTPWQVAMVITTTLFAGAAATLALRSPKNPVAALSIKKPSLVRVRALIEKLTPSHWMSLGLLAQKMNQKSNLAQLRFKKRLNASCCIKGASAKVRRA
jgi:hypothetical protein